jgi:hypothetical protein
MKKGSGAKVRRNWQVEALLLPKEVRQAVMDALLSGKSIGEVREELKLSLTAVCGTIDLNMVKATHRSLRRESL